MRLIILLTLNCLWLSACSSQQAYSTGQAYQRNECNKINDNVERSRCMDAANTGYDEYQRQKDVK